MNWNLTTAAFAILALGVLVIFEIFPGAGFFTGAGLLAIGGLIVIVQLIARDTSLLQPKLLPPGAIPRPRAAAGE
jgi:hypothetical protein